MQFTIQREALLKPLQRVAGAVEKRQQMPILSNVLVVIKNQLLSLTGTDLEVEMTARVPLSHPAEEGAIAIPGRKLIDICKALPEQSMLTFTLSDSKMQVRSHRSRYTLLCLPAENFPRVEEAQGEIELSLPQSTLRQLLEATSFAMAHQDVRYYLNGVCMQFGPDGMRLVATDGHRLATIALPLSFSHLTENTSIIVPRKAVAEMQRLFAEEEEEIGVVIGKNHLRMVMPHFSFITKLVEGKFPDYRRLLPQGKEGQHVVLSRESLRQTLVRVAALFSDRSRGVGLQFSQGLLRVIAVTPDKDEVEDEMEIIFEGEAIEIGINVSYLIEYLSFLKSESVKVSFTDSNQVILFEAAIEQGQHAYIVMPMRL